MGGTEPTAHEHETHAVARVVRALDGGGATLEVLRGGNVVTVISELPLNASERGLAHTSGARGVIELREDERRARAPELTAEVEQALPGRRVAVVLTACHVDPDLVVDTVVLEPVTAEAAHAGRPVSVGA